MFIEQLEKTITDKWLKHYGFSRGSVSSIRTDRNDTNVVYLSVINIHEDDLRELVTTIKQEAGYRAKIISDKTSNATIAIFNNKSESSIIRSNLTEQEVFDIDGRNAKLVAEPEYGEHVRYPNFNRAQKKEFIEKLVGRFSTVDPAFMSFEGKRMSGWQFYLDMRQPNARLVPDKIAAGGGMKVYQVDRKRMTWLDGTSIVATRYFVNQSRLGIFLQTATA